MEAVMPIAAGASVGLCPEHPHLAPMGVAVVGGSGRMHTHPSAPFLRDICPGFARLARCLGQPRGYLIKEMLANRTPGNRYVMWDPDRRVPLGLFTNRQDALDYGYTVRQVETTDLHGQSVRSSRKVDGWWNRPLVEIADWGWIPRDEVVRFTEVMLQGDLDAARSMIRQVEGRAHRPMVVADA